MLERKNFKSISYRPIAVKYGIILGVAQFLYSLLIQILGLTGETSISYLTYALIVGIILFGLKEYKGVNKGFMSFQKGLGLGVLLSLIAGIITGVINFIYTQIDDSVITVMLELTREALEMEMERNPQMTESFVDTMMEMYTNYVFTPTGLLFISILSTFIVGLIVSLISAAIMKKENPDEVPF